MVEQGEGRRGLLKNSQALLGFLTAAECGSIHGAAKELFISQPGLTKQIKVLEKELGFQLFVRSNRGVSLTEQGYKYYTGLRDFTARYRGLLDECRNMQQSCRNVLRVGYYTNSYIKQSFSLMVANSLLNKKTDAEVKICEIVLGGEKQALLEGRVDVLTAFDSSRFDQPQIGFTKLRNTGFFCIFPGPGFALGKERAEIADLRGHTVVLPKRGLFRGVDRLYDALSAEPSIDLEDVTFENSTTYRALMQKKLVINFGVPDFVENCRTLPFSWESIAHGVAYLRPPKPVVEKFIAEARELSSRRPSDYYAK